MNLFRSEEHIRNWAGFDPATEDGILSLPDLLKIFSGNYFRRRMDPDWVSRSREYGRELIGTLTEMGKTGPFWKRPKHQQIAPQKYLKPGILCFSENYFEGDELS